MKSIFDELSDRILKDPSLLKRSGPRQDLGLLLFNERESINALWKAAERCTCGMESDASAMLELLEAVGKLRPLFGERAEPPEMQQL